MLFSRRRIAAASRLLVRSTPSVHRRIVSTRERGVVCRGIKKHSLVSLDSQLCHCRSTPTGHQPLLGRCTEPCQPYARCVAFRVHSGPARFSRIIFLDWVITLRSAKKVRINSPGLGTCSRAGGIPDTVGHSHSPRHSRRLLLLCNPLSQHPGSEWRSRWSPMTNENITSRRARQGRYTREGTGTSTTNNWYRHKGLV